MIYEFCAENVTLLEKAMQAGARRIELCDNLAVGGTTPSYGVTKAAVELAVNYDTTIMTMIRCLLYTSPSPRDVEESRMPSSA